MDSDITDRLWNEHTDLHDALDDPTDKQLQEVRVCDLLEELRAEIVRLKSAIEERDRELLVAHRQIVHLGSNNA